jgi:hypothetical protein
VVWTKAWLGVGCLLGMWCKPWTGSQVAVWLRLDHVLGMWRKVMEGLAMTGLQPAAEETAF